MVPLAGVYLMALLIRLARISERSSGSAMIERREYFFGRRWRTVR